MARVKYKEKWESKEEYLEYLRHLAAYKLLAQEFVAGKNVLEIGCGTGYGAAFLSEVALKITATDIWEDVCSHQDKYQKANLIFLQANGTNLQFANSTFDVVLSFQVIEHIDEGHVLKYLSEIRRVLKTGGVFICSTPNRKLRLLPFQKPWNPEHMTEYTANQLKKLLGRVFDDVKICGIRGTQEVTSIHRRRWKQSPFTVYIALPLSKLISIFPPAISIPLKKTGRGFLQSKNIRDNKAQPQDFSSIFSLNDFRISSSPSKDWLDLYGICKKG